MPTSYTSAQKGAIAQFVGFTSVKDSVAAKTLKQHGWNVEQAIDGPKFQYQMDITATENSMPHDQTAQNDRRASILNEIQIGLEKKLAILHRIGNSEIDEEESSRQLLEEPCESSFAYTSTLIPKASESDILLSSFRDKESQLNQIQTAKAVFSRWCTESEKSSSWIKASNLLLMFKFAIRRPLLPESRLWEFLKELGLDPKLEFVDDLIVGDVKSARRYRQILLGISPATRWHVSSLERQYPKGMKLLFDQPEHPTGSNDQKSTEHEKLAELAACIAMYHSGRLSLDQAVLLIVEFLDDLISYKDVYSKLSSDRFDRIKPLSTSHSLWEKYLVMKKPNQQKVQHEELLPGDEFIELCNDLFSPNNSLPDAIRIIKEACREEEFSAIEKSYVLRNFDVPKNLFSVENIDKIPPPTPTDNDVTDKWPSPYGTRGSPQPKNLFHSSESYKSGRERVRRSSPEPTSPPGLVNTGKLPIALLNRGSPLRTNDSHDLRIKHQGHQDVPEAIPCSSDGTLRSYAKQSSQESKRKENNEKPSSSSSMPAPSQNVRTHNDSPNDSFDGTNIRKASSSPEEGISDDLFGLPLPTKAARGIAIKLKLPLDYVQSSIRSITPNRSRRKRFQKLHDMVTFPNKKLKTSSGSRVERDQGSKPNLHPELFARDGEDARDFVESHITADIFENTKRRFINELNAKVNPQEDPMDVAHQEPWDEENFNDPPCNSDPDEPEEISPPSSGCKLTFLSAFRLGKSPKSIIDVLTKAEAMPESDSKMNLLYRPSYIISLGLRNRVIKPPESDEERQLSALVHRLAQRCEEFVKRLPFKGNSCNPNLPRRPLKLLTYDQGPASFRKGMANPRILSVFNKNPDDFVTQDSENRIHHQPRSESLPGESFRVADTCSNPRRRHISGSPGFDQGFLVNRCSSKSGKHNTLLVNGTLRSCDSGLQRELRQLEKNANIANAEDAALEDRVSTSLFLALRRQVRKMANQKIPKYRYFQSSSGSASAANMSNTLNKLFERYRDDIQEPDSIGVEGSMRYLGDLGVKLDEPVLLAVLSELSAPTMGEFSRHGFVEGWKAHHADNLSKQQTIVATFRRSLSQNPDFFKRVYKSTFLLARNPSQKSLALDVAIEYWRLLLQAPSNTWNTRSTPWLDWWIAYLQEVWKKGISKDMWDQTGIFIQRSQEDESMAWWSEDGAWPGAIDEFVGFVREKRKGAAEGGGDGMEIA